MKPIDHIKKTDIVCPYIEKRKGGWSCELWPQAYVLAGKDFLHDTACTYKELRRCPLVIVKKERERKPIYIEG